MAIQSSTRSPEEFYKKQSRIRESYFFICVMTTIDDDEEGGRKRKTVINLISRADRTRRFREVPLAR